MSFESIIERSAKSISVLGLGGYGKSIVDDLDIPVGSADFIAIEDNGKQQNLDTLTELKLNELLIIIADVSDSFTINTLPTIISIANTTNILTLCFIFIPQYVHPAIF